MDWKARIRLTLSKSGHASDDDVVDELAQHARAMYESARADGASRDEAERRVELQIALWAGDAADLTRRSHHTGVVTPPPAVSSSPLAGLVQDVRYAGRLLTRQAGVTLVVVCTMALGIGAATLLFSVTYGVLMKPLPWPDADRLVLLEETRAGQAPRFNSFTNAAYLAWRERMTTIEEIAAWATPVLTLGGAGDPERIRATAATASLFEVLGLQPLIGRVVQDHDESLRDGAVVVLSESLWRQRFGADPAALGRIVQLDGRPHTLIGVLPDRAAFPDRETRAWVPFHVGPTTGNHLSTFSAIAKLRPGATPRQAADEGTARGRLAPDTGMTTLAIFGTDGPIAITARPLGAAVTAHVRAPLLVLLASVLLLLVSATANVAGLQLARATTRHREMAIRGALGAGTGRVARQLLVENLLLGLAGGGAGLAVAWLLRRVVPSLVPADFPRVNDVGIDTVVVLFALVASVLCSVVCGVLPALRLRRLSLVESLTESGTAAGASRRSGTTHARMLIMAGQVAIACVLLIGASLLGRSFLALLDADRGFDPSGVLTARLSMPASMYTPERRYALVDAVLSRLHGMAGVAEAAFTSELPLRPGGSTAAFTLRPRDAGSEPRLVQASPRIVSPRAFSALGMRIVAGRGFAESDTDTSEPVVVVNRAFARQYLGERPLGSRLPMRAGYGDYDADAHVVGVVEDVRYVAATDTSQPELYYSFRQFAGSLTVPVVTVLLRTTGDPAALAPALRTAVGEADAALVPELILSLQDRILGTLARPRLWAILLGGFAILAVAIAAVGLFGVLSYTVSQRSRELAVRAALGARPIDIVRLVAGQGLAVTAAGLGAGLLGSAVLTRTLAALLYGVTRHDLLTYVGVPVVLLLVATVACVVPARRAARLDPLRVLKEG